MSNPLKQKRFQLTSLDRQALDPDQGGRAATASAETRAAHPCCNGNRATGAQPPPRHPPVLVRWPRLRAGATALISCSIAAPCQVDDRAGERFRPARIYSLPTASWAAESSASFRLTPQSSTRWRWLGSESADRCAHAPPLENQLGCLLLLPPDPRLQRAHSNEMRAADMKGGDLPAHHDRIEMRTRDREQLGRLRDTDGEFGRERR